MKQKIAVIDYQLGRLEPLRQLLAGAGYEVLPILIEEGTYYESINKVKVFGPDLILTVHVLGIDGVNGSHVSRALDLPKTRLVGTDESKVAQPYCAARFDIKGVHASDSSKRKFIAFIKAALS
ncbi:MAG TPA: hypothetical protein VGE35_00710 [Candidatus Paceibacterota bacterium]